VGRRVRLIVPVGLEKRVCSDLYSLSSKLNAPGAGGYRLMVLPGEVFTELDALRVLTAAEVELVAAGGVCGAEGACWVSVTGEPEQEEFAEQVVASLSDELPFTSDFL